LETEAEAAGRQLEDAFRRVHAGRMRGMPLCNPALDVEAVGFTRTEDAVVGVIITPWAMNLVHVPDAAPFAEGKTGSRYLPRGPVDFVGARIEGFGAYESCSLFSPVFHFSGQPVARAVAAETLALLLQPSPDRPDPTRPVRGDGPLAALRRNADRGFDRRGFLRGDFFSEDTDSR
jgi:[NiFe] hydrogenase assembly HybE family chaperone